MEALEAVLSELAGQDYCYLTTIGRVSGRPHEIEIWFGVKASSLYLLAGGGTGLARLRTSMNSVYSACR